MRQEPTEQLNHTQHACISNINRYIKKTNTMVNSKWFEDLNSSETLHLLKKKI